MIIGPSGPRKGRYQEEISAGRNPKAVLLVVDVVSRFSARGCWDAASALGRAQQVLVLTAGSAGTCSVHLLHLLLKNQHYLPRKIFAGS